VIVEEVRVIPLGARVQANFPGGVRLGATNPAQFNLEFFVNDLSKSGASTFESLGILEVHVRIDRFITDSLMIFVLKHNNLLWSVLKPKSDINHFHQLLQYLKRLFIFPVYKRPSSIRDPFNFRQF